MELRVYDMAVNVGDGKYIEYASKSSVDSDRNVLTNYGANIVIADPSTV